jgi:hypothetical protein
VLRTSPRILIHYGHYSLCLRAGHPQSLTSWRQRPDYQSCSVPRTTFCKCARNPLGSGATDRRCQHVYNINMIRQPFRAADLPDFDIRLTNVDVLKSDVEFYTHGVVVSSSLAVQRPACSAVLPWLSH